MIPQGRQASEHWGYVAPDVPYDCGQCITRHAEEYGFPTLTDAHVEAWHLMLLLHDQQRVGMEPIGLDYGVLPAVFEMEGIPRERWQGLFRQLVALNHVWQSHYAKQREERKEAQAAQAKLKGGRRG